MGPATQHGAGLRGDAARRRLPPAGYTHRPVSPHETTLLEQAAAILRSSAPYRTLSARLGEATRLPLPAAAWVAELLAADLGRPLLVLVPRESDALAWAEAARLFGRAELVLPFPAPSLTPYQEADSSLLVRAQESVALDRLSRGVARTVVATPRALFRRLPGAALLAGRVLALRVGEEQPPGLLAELLVGRGFTRRDLVAEVGDFAVRGGVFDLFPPGEEQPIRLDLFGDTIESIRRFDPVSQRSAERLEEAMVPPLSLFPAGAAEAMRLAGALSRLCGADPGAEAAEHLESLRRHGSFPGWENYLPVLAAETVNLADLLPGALIVAVDPPQLFAEIQHHEQRLDADWQARIAHARLAVPPDALEFGAGQVLATVAGAELSIGDLFAATATAVDFAATTTDIFHGQLPRFPREVETARARGERLVLVAPRENHARLREFLGGREVAVESGGVELLAGDLQRGFRLPAAGLVIFGEPQLFAVHQAPLRRSRPRHDVFLSGLRDLKVGDYVVHGDHGIGKFVALRGIAPSDSAPGGLPPALRAAAPAAAVESEVMEIAYAGGKRLLLPLARLDLVQKYSGMEGAAPKLDQLGGTSWNKTKARVKNAMRDMADELLKLYAARQLARAPACPPDDDMMHQFEAAFAYEETPDQLEAIAAIKADLERERPMDRLLCGDVGYGKTEVAMRAAMKAVGAGHQVAVLCPTTILADQHWETFQERFAGFPVSIEMVSRFRTAPEIAVVQKKIAANQVDILIGTHRVLSKDVALQRLGLLIVDEEQRFGVAQKDRLKQIKKQVHVLAMSATPVPRTLQFSLAGVRDLSVIETPPKDRMAVETAILPFSDEVVKEAIEYERARGGQVYYVYNQVETIERMQAWLRELVPDLRITVGHGQMDERELSRRMHAFTAGDYDLLLASTIIENGIDIPNVNTMIVHRAERFGLAQLYQLRGRVGRSHQLAYCYLLVAADRILTEDARKRLDALREFSDLGAGFRIAARDLEIRGAGNLLGGEQSGQIASVGMDTYIKMLEQTVRELRGETVEEGPSTALDLPVAMAIPAEYIADPNLRMEAYRKIAAGGLPRQELLAELRDRFGKPPATVVTLLDVADLKRQAEALRVQSVSAAGNKLIVRLRRDARVSVEKLIAMVSTRAGASFSPTGVLTLEAPGGGEEMLRVARAVLAELAEGAGNGEPSVRS
jgi:transcription-repair coupling factor (superfamily II helicase)